MAEWNYFLQFDSHHQDQVILEVLALLLEEVSIVKLKRASPSVMMKLIPEDEKPDDEKSDIGSGSEKTCEENVFQTSR